MASIVGPALGAVIVAAAAPGWALAADGVTFALSAIFLARIDLPRTLRASGRSMLADFRDGWREFTSRSWLVAVDGAVWFSTLQEKIPADAISRVSSFDWFGSVALNPIGYALVGPLSEAIGVGHALELAGALNVGSSVLMLAIPSVRSLPAGPEVAEPGGDLLL